MQENTQSLAKALWAGARGRCPRCGEGHIFSGFLKVARACDRCGEPLHHHRADDLPAYLVMVVVGHVIVGLLLWVEKAFHPSFVVHAALWLPLTLVMSLVLLQPVKGAVVAFQWHAGMHGFAVAKASPHPARADAKAAECLERG